MKKYLLLILLTHAGHLFAQKAELNDNTISYRGRTYTPGDIVQLGYGSGGKKEFSFVHYGKSIAGVNLPGIYHNANADWSKADVEVLKVYTEKGVVWAKCNPVNHSSSLGSALGNKIYINIEGAADNNEIAGVDHSNAGKKGKSNDLNDLVATGKNKLLSGKEKIKMQTTDLVEKGKNTLQTTKEKIKLRSTDLKEKEKNTLATGKEKIKTQSDELLKKGKALVSKKSQ